MKDPLLFEDKQLDEILEIIANIRIVVARGSGADDVEQFVIKLIRCYENIDRISLRYPSKKERAIQLLNSLRCLRKDYKRGGMNSISNRLPVLMATFRRREFQMGPRRYRFPSDNGQYTDS
jgi:hypothetical protein